MSILTVAKKALRSAVVLAACLGWTAHAQSSLVEESRMHAVLEADHVKLHFALARPITGELTVWLLSPDGTLSGKTRMALSGTDRAPTLTLPWPKDAKGEPVSSVAWYRIGYRVEPPQGTPIDGILSVGAIATNLVDLRVALATRLPAPGQPLQFTAYVRNSVSGQGYEHAELTATLKDDLGHVLARATAVSAHDGAASMQIQVPSTGDADIGLTVTARRGAAAGVLAPVTVGEEIHVANRVQMAMQTDKPLHKPGETVHLRVLAFDGARKALAGGKLVLTLKDSDGKEVEEIPLKTNRFGIATYDWITDPHLATGEYAAEVRLPEDDSRDGSARLNLRVDRYDLPEFRVTAAAGKSFYLEGDKPVLHVRADYLFGKPVSGGTVRVVPADDRTYGNHSPEPAHVPITAKLDAAGRADVPINPTEGFSELKENSWERTRPLRLVVEVEDPTTGKTESRRTTVLLARQPANIYLQMLGGNSSEGDFLVATSTADRRPLPAHVTLEWMQDGEPQGRAGTITTGPSGYAKLHLTFPPKSDARDTSSLAIRCTLQDEDGRKSILDETIYRRSRDEDAIWITLERSLLRPNEPIEAVVHAPAGSLLGVMVLSESGLLARQQLRMSSSEEPLTIPAAVAFRGLVTLWVYNLRTTESDASSYYGGAGNASKSVVYPKRDRMSLSATGLAASYKPGDAVHAVLQLKGRGAEQGVFGVSVADQAVDERAMSGFADEDGWYSFGHFLTQNFDSSEQLQDPLSWPDGMNDVDMTEPVTQDMQLNAEAMLMNGGFSGTMVQNDDLRDRWAYQQLAVQTVKPLVQMLNTSGDVVLPASLPALQALAEHAGIASSVLVDPWSTPYRMRLSHTWQNEILEFIGAGPDKRFDTDDDFVVTLSDRSLFHVPGKKLTALLESATDAGESLPVDQAHLLSFAQSKGLDLATILDPAGKPYRFEISVDGPSYVVRVFRLEKAKEGSEANSPIWTSRGIHYFEATLRKIEAALRSWEASGHLFPSTESECRDAMAAAGITDLHDALGNPLAIRIREQWLYTRNTQVTAGGKPVDASAKPISAYVRLIRFVQPHKGEADRLVGEMSHTLKEQSGAEAQPVSVAGETFRANTGAIGGAVFDSSGAAVSNATIAVFLESGDTVIGQETSDKGGLFTVRDLLPGVYRIQISAPGFQTLGIRGVTVSTFALTSVEAKLQIGAVAETVTVSSEAVMLNTSSSTIGRTVVVRTAGEASVVVTTPVVIPRLRHVFDETAYWAPVLEAGKDGRANLNFKLPDTLTTWKMHVLASTMDGRIRSLDRTFRSFQPFFVDLDPPQFLTNGDEVDLPVNLRNYTQRRLNVKTLVQRSDWFTLNTPAASSAAVDAGASSTVIVGLKASRITDAGALRVTATAAADGDAVEKSVHVRADGKPVVHTVSGLAKDGQTLSLDVPEDAVQGSLHATLRLYPNLAAKVEHAVTAVMVVPHGCAEQTISSAYPSLLYLQLEKAGRPVDPARRERAVTFLALGYRKLLGYFAADGGLTYWGSGDGDPALTAYAIEFLSAAEEFVDVDESVIDRAVDWLVMHQLPDGSWKGLGGSRSASTVLYVAVVLQGVGPQARMRPVIERAVAWANTSAAAADDSYCLALRMRLEGQDQAAVMAKLVSLARHDKNGTYWSSWSRSPFYGWGRAGEIETTAQVLASLHGMTLADDALLYLLSSQDSNGIWLSGQATVRVLQALLSIATEHSDGVAPRVLVNGQPLPMLEAEGKTATSPREMDLAPFLKAGHNVLSFAAAGASAASVEATAEVAVPWSKESAGQMTANSEDAGMDFGYRCETENLHAGRPVECVVKWRRFGTQGGMLLAEVGIPPGAQVDRLSLASLVDSGAVSQYELQPDRVVFYLWSWTAEPHEVRFRFMPRYAIRAKTPPARLTDYYNPDLNVMLAPQMFRVEGR